MPPFFAPTFALSVPLYCPYLLNYLLKLIKEETKRRQEELLRAFAGYIISNHIGIQSPITLLLHAPNLSPPKSHPNYCQDMTENRGNNESQFSLNDSPYNPPSLASLNDAATRA
jgi:hypothetical protein